METCQQTISKATQLGAKVVVPKQEVPNMGFTAILSDPDNNVFGLWQPIQR